LALRWVHTLDPDVVWALEVCRHVPHHLERALVTSGDRVIRVPPNRMGESRKAERQPGKSDQIDARAIARAVLRDGIDVFPGAYLDEQAMEIRLLSDHRHNQVAEITRLTNRLRWNLVILDPTVEASIPARKMDFPCHLDRVARRLGAMEPSARVRIAKEQVRMIPATKRAPRFPSLPRSCADGRRVFRFSLGVLDRNRLPVGGGQASSAHAAPWQLRSASERDRCNGRRPSTTMSSGIQSGTCRNAIPPDQNVTGFPSALLPERTFAPHAANVSSYGSVPNGRWVAVAPPAGS
jgi:hypothetical protein